MVTQQINIMGKGITGRTYTFTDSNRKIRVQLLEVEGDEVLALEESSDGR